MIYWLYGREARLSQADPGKTIIGLTGNIAVGKSAVMALLAELGADAIDADQVARQVLRADGGAYAPVLAAFGRDILGADGEIDRAALGKIVFADAARLQELEALTHPPIREEIDRRVRAAKPGVLVIEAIKLLEGPLKDKVDAVWVVDASPARQKERLMKRRGMSAEEAERRIALQNSQADKLRQADLVIDNNGDLEQLRARVQQAYADLAFVGARR